MEHQTKEKELDWNFIGSKSDRDHHAIHPYPAKFISEIPKQLIETLGIRANQAILDPFCGSGTTLAVAQQLGIESYGVDLNPIACLISKVKTSEYTGCSDLRVEELITEAIETQSPDFPDLDIPNVDHWFKKEVQEKIYALRRAIMASESTEELNFLLLSLSRILVKVSNQDSDTRYAAVVKSAESYNVYEHFRKSTAAVTSMLKKRSYDHVPATVLNGNILEMDISRVEKKVGLIITSPPYPNAYEYWLYHKYRMFWLNHDPIRVKEAEIGARAHFFKKNRHTPEDFYNQMKRTLEQCIQASSDEAKMAFVVGRSKIHGEVIDNANIIVNAAKALGLKHIDTYKREMRASRKSFNLSHANIKEESIVVLGKNK
ncbi:MAG: DNA methyltransferase [Hydrogenovibrio sp.]|uniref:DNA methyltransferase n=1 Tax=Hydrogenovibrio sp. TaxID=2065821 RepID=UPI00287095C3|nr:DNA methyltransferase [Hydrogenovibrio sp.]MDR9498380.1 DNA methyltransferase [Hydrogenovibrio sp.]